MTPKLKVVWAMAGFALANGIAMVLAPAQQWQMFVEVVGTLGLSLLAFAWYCFDARERAFRRIRMQDFGVAAVALVGMPIYLVRTRGAGRGALAFAGMVLFYLLLIILLLLGGVLGVLVRMATGMPLPN